MKIDYASYTFVPPPRKQKNLRRIGLFISIFILIGLIAFSGWCYVKVSSSQKVQLFAARIKNMFSHKKITTNKLPQTTTEPPPVQFNFYSELPNVHLTPKVESPPPVKKIIPSAVPSQGKYIVQLGAYNELNSASQQRLSFLLIGVESQILPLSVKGEKTYRLQQGPFATAAEAKAAQKKLLKKGVDASIKAE